MSRTATSHPLPRPPRSGYGERDMLRALQEENTSLRYELLRTRRERDTLQAQLQRESRNGYAVGHDFSVSGGVSLPVDHVSVADELTDHSPNNTIARPSVSALHSRREINPLQLSSNTVGKTEAAIRSRQARATTTRTNTAAASSSSSSQSDSRVGHRAELTRLRRQCKNLARRLLASVRERQDAHSAEVALLLRTLHQERAFMHDMISDLSAEAAGEGGGPVDSGAPMRALHMSALRVRMVHLTESLHARRAALTLRQAHARLLLDKSQRLVHEAHLTVRQVAQVLFDTIAALEAYVCAPLNKPSFTLHGHILPIPAPIPIPTAATASPLSCSPLPNMSRSAASGAALRRTTDTKREGEQKEEDMLWRRGQWTESPCIESTARTPVALCDGLRWSCDALKACVLGLDEVHEWMHHTAEVVSECGLDHDAPAPGAVRMRNDDGQSGGAKHVAETVTDARHLSCPQDTAYNDSNTQKATQPLHPLLLRRGVEELLSPEVVRLLREFTSHLDHLSARAAVNQSRLMHRLSNELQRHYRTVKRQERRIRQLERQNARHMCARLSVQHAMRRRVPSERDDANPSSASAAVRGGVQRATRTPADALTSSVGGASVSHGDSHAGDMPLRRDTAPAEGGGFVRSVHRGGLDADPYDPQADHGGTNTSLTPLSTTASPMTSSPISSLHDSFSRVPTPRGDEENEMADVTNTVTAANEVNTESMHGGRWMSMRGRPAPSAPFLNDVATGPSDVAAYPMYRSQSFVAPSASLFSPEP